MTMNEWTIFKDLGILAITASGAWFGLRTYATNALTRRAEFLVDLHKDFFVEEKYRPIRQVLDSETERAVQERVRLIREEPENFIEFLNFFELVAYLCKCKNLAFEDAEALLGYYLRLLVHRNNIREYIRDKTRNGFEHLDGLLDKIERTR
jgi:hypothetical protein